MLKYGDTAMNKGLAQVSVPSGCWKWKLNRIIASPTRSIWPIYCTMLWLKLALDLINQNLFDQLL